MRVVYVVGAAVLLVGAAAAGAAVQAHLNTSASALPAAMVGGAESVAWAPEWAFAARVVQPPESNGNGSVVVVLSNLMDANASAARGVPVQVAATAWPSDWVSTWGPSLGMRLEERVTRELTAAPAVAFAQATLSRAGDGVELAVPAALNASTVIVYAPEAAEFMFIDWASGQPFRYDEGTFQWRALDARSPVLLARGPEAAP